MAHSRLTPRARDLRLHDTEAEHRLWRMLRNRQLGGWKWKRQVPRGPFIVDFLCPELGLVVELDGGQHAEQIAYDEARTRYLRSLDLTVIRFWNHEVFTNLDGVCATVLAACGGEAPHLASPRERGEEWVRRLEAQSPAALRGE